MAHINLHKFKFTFRFGETDLKINYFILPIVVHYALNGNNQIVNYYQTRHYFSFRTLWELMRNDLINTKESFK